MADTSFVPLALNNSVQDILKQLRNHDDNILSVISTERYRMQNKSFGCSQTHVCRLMLAKENTKLVSHFNVDGNHPLVSLGMLTLLGK